jgi:hypothetical protein
LAELSSAVGDHQHAEVGRNDGARYTVVFGCSRQALAQVVDSAAKNLGSS